VTIALIDNGSIEAAAHLNLRRVAAELSTQTGRPVEALSWKHSDRISAAALQGVPAQTLRPWLAAKTSGGERKFLFVPFFVSAQGAIGSALRRDLEDCARELGGFSFNFVAGLAERDALVPIVVARVRETIAQHSLHQPSLVVVDHGGPSPASATLRNELTRRIGSALNAEVSSFTAASMEGAEHPHNRPLLAEALQAAAARRAIVVAPLFLSPGRHAGPGGDLAVIAQEAFAGSEASAPTFHFTELIGTHPDAVTALAASLLETLGKERGPAAYP
jgi:sirohydrochlorin ferrochelatase